MVNLIRENRDRINNVLSILVFLAIWEIFSRFIATNMKIFPPPSIVGQELWRMVESGMLVEDMWASVKRSLAGFALGSTIAIVIGLLTGRIPFIRALLEPVIQLFRPIPSIAFVPLSLFWFGLGESSKVFLITYGVFFPVWLNTHVGVSTVDPVLIRAARSLGCEGRRLFTRVILPASIPFVVAGLRVGIAVAFIVLVAAEMLGASAGVGFRIGQSHEVYRADRMMVGLLTLGVMGGLADSLFAIASKKIVFWTGEARRE
jgi:ABC-type nitrate/sulfonate/bicarbonate transport system permease component